MPVTVEVDPALDPISGPVAKALLIRVIKGEGFDLRDISIIFGNDELLRQLKRDFFHKNQLTDVIAFRMNDYESDTVDGEIYISLPRAKENAEKFGEPFKREIGRLIIHGGLHLLNFNDQTVKEKKVMTQMEEKYLNDLNWQDLIDE